MKPSQTAVQNYIQKMDELGVILKGTHWVLPEEKDKKNAPRNILTKVTRLYLEMGVLSKDKQLIKMCDCFGCYNPFHYSPIHKFEKEVRTETDWLEVEDLASLIDLNELADKGFWGYLAKFNYKNPLPAKSRDFYDACNICLVKKKLERIPYATLMMKKDGKLEDKNYKRLVEER